MENDSEQVTAHLHNDKNMTMERKVQMYDNTASTYDERVKKRNYSAPRICAEVVSRYFPYDRENISILDVACGTGQAAEEMRKKGFKVFDGLDPAKGMLKEADKKNIYRNLYCDYFTSKPLAFLKDKYDLVTVVGSMNIGFIPYDAVFEMIRLTKPGGIVCIVNRKSPLYEFQEYAFFPLCNKLEKEGKWEKQEMTDFNRYLGDADGIIVVYRVK